MGFERNAALIRGGLVEEHELPKLAGEVEPLAMNRRFRVLRASQKEQTFDQPGNPLALVAGEKILLITYIDRCLDLKNMRTVLRRHAFAKDSVDPPFDRPNLSRSFPFEEGDRQFFRHTRRFVKGTPVRR
jgi:hypothetical protein